MAVPRLTNSPMELAHMLYEALLIRNEFAKILNLKITINLWFNIYAPRWQYVHTRAYGLDSNVKFDR